MGLIDRSTMDLLGYTIRRDNYTNVAMIQKYYEDMRIYSAIDGDDDYFDMELNCDKRQTYVAILCTKEIIVEIWR